MMTPTPPLREAKSDFGCTAINAAMQKQGKPCLVVGERRPPMSFWARGICLSGGGVGRQWFS